MKLTRARRRLFLAKAAICMELLGMSEQKAIRVAYEQALGCVGCGRYSTLTVTWRPDPRGFPGQQGILWRCPARCDRVERVSR